MGKGQGGHPLRHHPPIPTEGDHARIQALVHTCLEHLGMEGEVLDGGC